MKPIGIITGATGYIGSHLTQYLLSQGWDIHIIAQPEFGYKHIESFKEQIHIYEYKQNVYELIDYFRYTKADAVFHLAAAVITQYSPGQIPTLIQSNIQFGTEVLEAMKCSGIRNFIGTGSYWQNYNTNEYNPVDLYAATKEGFEKILQYYVDAHRIKAITLRLYDIYGEDDDRPKLWTLLQRIAGTTESIDVSPGGQYIDLVHIIDVCKAYLCAYNYMVGNEKLTNEIYSVRTGKQYTLKELVHIYEKCIGKTIHVNWGARPYKPREVMHPIAAYTILPNWEAEISPMMGFSRFAK